MATQSENVNITGLALDTTSAVFSLLGGLYGWTVISAAWDGTVQLLNGGPDGEFTVDVLGADANGNSYQTLYLPPGSYMLNNSDNTDAVSSDLTRIPV